MHIKGPNHPFAFSVPQAADPKENESAHITRDATQPDIAKESAANRRVLSGGTLSHRLRSELATHLQPMRSRNSKRNVPPDSLALQPERALDVLDNLALTHAQNSSQHPVAIAITKLILGTSQEKAEAQQYLAKQACAVAGLNSIVEAEINAWNDRELKRPGF